MNNPLIIIGAIVVVAVLGWLLFTGGVTGPIDAVGARDSVKIAYESDGSLIRPDIGYRQWIFVGTPVTPNDMNNGSAPFPEFHNVYINPKGYAGYEKTGVWPEGTVMLKELTSVGAKQASSGNGYFMGDFIGLEVAIKDINRYPDEPDGWAYYSFGHSYPLLESAMPQATGSCAACHVANAGDNMVFTQYYPVLRAAKP